MAKKIEIIRREIGIFRHNLANGESLLNAYIELLSDGTVRVNANNYSEVMQPSEIYVYDKLNDSLSTSYETIDLLSARLKRLGYTDWDITSNSQSLPNPIENMATTNTPGILKLSEDLGGNADAPKVVGIQGIPVSNTTPSFGDLLLFNGTSYVPTALAALISIGSDEFISTASQTVFALAHKPIGNVSIVINGVRISKQAVLIGSTNNQVVYVPSGNGNYQLEAGDLVIFDYKY